MNRAKAHAALDALLDAIEEGEPEAPTRSPKPASEVKVDELARAKARKILRERLGER